jgi:PKD repeat protein
MYKKIIGIGIIILFIASTIIPMSFGYNVKKYPSILNESNNMFVSFSGIPPVANFTIINDSMRGFVVFDGSMSYDPDGIIVSYEWDYGNGTSDNGSYYDYVHHQYCDSDIIYNMTLTVTDNEGLKGNLTKSVYVVWANCPPPILEIKGPSSGGTGTEYEYEFRAIYPEDFLIFL